MGWNTVIPGEFTCFWRNTGMSLLDAHATIRIADS